MNQLCTRCKVLTEEGAHVDLRYYITCSDTAARKYGVCIEMCIDGGTTSRTERNALFFTAAEAAAFGEMLAHETVTPETLGDVVEDWM